MMDSEEEDNYDVFNDETFGNVNETEEEFKWEPDWKYLEGCRPINPQIPNQNQVSYMKYRWELPQDAVGATASEFENFENENDLELEASISRLLMDDYDDADTESVEDQIAGEPNGVNKQTCYSWFGEQGLGDSSLLGASLWSMNPIPSLAKPVHNHLKTLSETLSSNSNSNIPFRDQEILMHNEREKAHKIFLHNQMKMDLFSGVGEPLSTVASPSTIKGQGQLRKSNIKTVEEIEAEIIGQFHLNSVPPRPIDITSTRMRQAEMTVMTVKDIVYQTAHSLRGVSELECRSQNLHSIPAPQPIRPLPPLVPQIYNPQTHELRSRKFYGEDKHGSSHPMANSFPIIVPMGPFCRDTILPWSVPLGFPPNDNGQASAFQYQNMMPPERQCFQTNFKDFIQHTYNTNDYDPPPPPHLPKMPRPFRQKPPRSIHGGCTIQGYWDELRAKGMLGRDIDPYSNFMTEKEKQRLKNIQMIQLQNDHPHSVDYYFQMKKLKNLKAEDKLERENIFRKLYPDKSTDYSSNTYEPTHFENSLGKLQVMSALAPKKMLDSGIVIADSEDIWRSPSRSVLIVIERMYKKVLQMEEADFRTTLHYSDENFVHYPDREEDLEWTWKTLDLIGIEEVSKYTKGQVLLCKILSMTEPEIRRVLFTHIVVNLSTWFKGKAETSQTKTIYECLRKALLSTNLMEFITSVLTNLDSNSEIVKAMFKSKVGSSFLMCVLHIAEAFCKTPDFNSKMKENIPNIFDEPWRTHVSEILEVIAKGQIVIPFEVFPSLMQLADKLDLYQLLHIPSFNEKSVLDSRLTYFVKEGSSIFTE